MNATSCHWLTDQESDRPIERNHAKPPMSCGNNGAPGRIRTCDTGFRRAVLYPLSYEGGRD